MRENRAPLHISPHIFLWIFAIGILYSILFTDDNKDALLIINVTKSNALVERVSIGDEKINKTEFDLLANSYHTNKILKIRKFGVGNLSVQIKHDGNVMLAKCQLLKPSVGEQCLYKASFNGSENLKCICDSFHEISK